MKMIAVKVFQLKQFKRRNLKKFRLERESGEPMSSAIPVQSLYNFRLKLQHACT